MDASLVAVVETISSHSAGVLDSCNGCMDAAQNLFGVLCITSSRSMVGVPRVWGSCPAFVGVCLLFCLDDGWPQNSVAGIAVVGSDGCGWAGVVENSAVGSSLFSLRSCFDFAVCRVLCLEPIHANPCATNVGFDHIVDDVLRFAVVLAVERHPEAAGKSRCCYAD